MECVSVKLIAHNSVEQATSDNSDQEAAAANDHLFLLMLQNVHNISLFIRDNNQQLANLVTQKRTK